jgi:hypothetical protein
MRRAALLTLLGVTIGLGGCTTDGQDVATLRQGGGTALAFESIDGPPPQVFDRMVSAVNAEAQARSVPVTSRADPAAYKVRAYLAAELHRGRTVIAWVWDVYDRDQQRAMRLSGAETAGKTGRGDAWAAADDQVIARIAQRGMAGVAGLVSGNVSVGAPEPQAAPRTSPNGAPAPENAAIADATGATPDESGSSAASRIALSYAEATR